MELLIWCVILSGGGGGGVPVLFLVTGTKNRVLVPTCTDMYS